MFTLKHALPLVASLLAGSALAQTPFYIAFPNNTNATDVTVTANHDVVVVGTNSSGNVFRWTYSSGVMTDLGPNDGSPHVSDDGTKVSTTTTGMDGQTRAAIWNLSTGLWTQGPGLGSQSGTSESSANGLSGDGSRVVGLGWVTANDGHCYSWTPPSLTAQDYGGATFPSSNGLCANFDGSFIGGFKDDPTGQRFAASWLSGVLQPRPTYFDVGTSTTFDLGQAAAVNSAGTTMIGQYFYVNMPPSAYDSAAWRWDMSTGTLPLFNLPGETDQAQPFDLTDDGKLIIGHNGWNPFFSFSTLQSVVWVNNAPQSLFGYLAAKGTTGMTGLSDLGFPTAISHDGGAICGTGGGFFAPGTGNGGWVVILPENINAGTSYCFGDGTGASCPCSNSGSAGNGCANSSFAGGAHLAGSGFASIASDSVALTATNIPGPGLFFQGDATASATFGDGLLCVGGTLIRMGIVFPTGSTASYPGGSTPNPIHIAGSTASGNVRHYQCWYRDAASFCVPATFNLTQGVSITWQP